jgi:ribA/ribD-fused uncharacterized protein
MINKFEGEYAFLSNFYHSPFTHDGITYPTNEHFFQAYKTLDIAEKKAIAAAETPGQAKRMGRNVKLRSDWERIKSSVMELGLRLKFTEHPDLRQALIDTAPAQLVEGTTWHDRTWGVCMCPRCGGRGENRLGQLLMKLRDEYTDEIE